MAEPDRQAIVDAEHLRILSICYMVAAGMHVLFSLFGLLYVVMGVFVSTAISHMPPQTAEPPPPQFFALMFGLLGGGLFVLMIAAAGLQFLVAIRLRQRRSRTLCLVIGALTCIEIPYGTALGVFTLIVLSRPSVAAAFDHPPASAT